MTAYRNDYDAAILLNTHLERDVKDLLKENDELKTRNRCLGAIAKDMLGSEPCWILGQRIDTLVTENILLSMEKAMLEQEPQQELLDEIDRLVEKQKDAMGQIRRLQRNACLGVFGWVGLLGALRLFW